MKALRLSLVVVALVALALPVLAAAPPAAVAPASQAAVLAAPATLAPAAAPAVASPSSELPLFLASPPAEFGPTAIFCPHTPPNCCAFRCTGSCCICTKTGAGCGNL